MIWLVKRVIGDEGETYDVMRDGERVLGVSIKGNEDVGTYRAAALCLRANVIRRLEDPEPVFAVDAGDETAVSFVEMLNAA